MRVQLSCIDLYEIYDNYYYGQIASKDITKKIQSCESNQVGQLRGVTPNNDFVGWNDEIPMKGRMIECPLRSSIHSNWLIDQNASASTVWPSYLFLIYLKSQ